MNRATPDSVQAALVAGRARVARLRGAAAAATRAVADAEQALEQARRRLEDEEGAQRDGHAAGGSATVARLLHRREAHRVAVLEARRRVEAARDVLARSELHAAAAKQELADTSVSIRAMERLVERKAIDARRAQERRDDA